MDQGYAKAPFNLGFLYEHGHGVVKDYVDSAKWYKKAADQGNKIAEALLKSLTKKIEI